VAASATTRPALRSRLTHLLDAVGQPEDEMLDGHGAVCAPTNVYGRLKNTRHISRPSDQLIPCAYLEKGSIGSRWSGTYLGHHRHEHLGGGRYPLLQERLQYRVVLTADHGAWHPPFCLIQGSELTVAALELIRPLLMIKGTWSICSIQSLMAERSTTV
jgi:hypothetical protein